MNTTGKLVPLHFLHPDFSIIFDMDQAYFPRPWSKNDWLSLREEHHIFLGWRLQDQLIGFGLFSLIPGDDTAHLLKICFNPDVRGQGYASLFWEQSLTYLKSKGARAIYLEVEGQNSQAIRFYQKKHFQTLRTIKNYYSDGADALTMHVTI